MTGGVDQVALTGAALGLLAALSWGVSNVFIALVGRSLATFRSLAFWQTASVILAIGLLTLGGARLPSDINRLTPAIIAGTLCFLGYVGLYVGLALGPIAVVSPVIAANGGLTVVLAVLFLGETLHPGEVLGVVLATAGVLLTGVRFRRAWRETRVVGPGVIAGLFSLMLFGAFNVASAVASRELGWQTGFAASRLTTATLAFMALAVPTPRMLRMRGTGSDDSTSRLAAYLVIGSTASAIGFIGYYYGFEIAPAWIVGLTSSFSPVVVVLAGVLVLKERLAPPQWLGAGLVMTSLLLIGT